MLEMIGGEGPIGRLLDIGTGTGRMLELLAPHSERSIGIDVDHDMLHWPGPRSATRSSRARRCARETSAGRRSRRRASTWR